MKKGDKIYVGTKMSISNGENDVKGGLATISSIIDNPNLPNGHYNKTSVTVEELPGHSYNVNNLIENQEKWAKLYGDDIAKPDPDINTPWIQSGDIVNGEVYNGKDIW